MKIRILGFIIFVSFLTSCEKLMIKPDKKETPIEIFEDFWSIYDKHYANFVVKNIDWDAVYKKYRPLVSNDMSQEQLLKVLADIYTKVLKDNHSYIQGLGKSAGVYMNVEGDRVWPTLYDYKALVTLKQDNHPFLDYGVIKNNEDIGFIVSKNFTEEFYSFSSFKKEVDKAMLFCKDKKAIILDIRNHGGGQEPWGNYFTGRFSTTTYDYLKERRRINSNRTTLSDAATLTIKPSGEFQYTKPVILLTNRMTGSAGDVFTLSMKQVPNVTCIGDTTMGIFSGGIYRELINGWVARVSVSEVKTIDGKSYEGIGVAPDIYIKVESNIDGDVTDINQEIKYTDTVLKEAIKLIK